VNLGDFVPNDKHEVRIHVTANLQAFGMIVTAEAYFAVTRPSNVTVRGNARINSSAEVAPQCACIEYAPLFCA
jgi:hypothetical protein